MRRIVRSEAVVLRARDWRESSRTVTLFTPDTGLVAVIARGARRPRSRTAAALNLFAHSRVIYYRHETRQLYNLSDAELLAAHSAIAQVPERYFCAGRMVDFLLHVLHPHDANERLYALLLANLAVVEHSDAAFPELLAAFLLKAAAFLGFRPELRRCVVCRRGVGGEAVWFDPLRGGAVCRDCAGERSSLRPLAAAGLAALDDLLHTPTAEVAALARGADPLPPVLEFLSVHFEKLPVHALAWPADTGLGRAE
jgi:DNA repair protein RecO (recombination protein O)